MLPTPTAQDAKNSTLPPSQMDRDSLPGHLLRTLPTPPPVKSPPAGESGTRAGLRLSPQFVEWMMGFPEGWTDLD